MGASGARQSIDMKGQQEDCSTKYNAHIKGKEKTVKRKIAISTLSRKSKIVKFIN